MQTNNIINHNTNYSNNVSNLNGSNITSDNIKINILKNLDEKYKNNSSLKIKNISNNKSLNIKNRNYSNISNILNNSASCNKYFNNNKILSNNDINVTNYSRAKSIRSKDIKRFNTFVKIEDAFFKLKNEKSLEKINFDLKEKEKESVFNSSMNCIL